MTKENQLSDQELDDVFAQEAANEQTLSPALMQRILEDADQVLAAQKAPEISARPAGQFTLWHSFISAIGGWPGIGGLATATVVGIWIGFSPPAAIDELAETYLADKNSAYDFGDFMPSIDDLLSEG